MAAALLMRSVLATALSLSAQSVSVPRPLEGTYWKAIELDGRQVPAQVREIYLLLQQEGRVSGSDGCNRVAGLFRTDGTAVRFSDVAVTKMACIDGVDLSAALYKALRRAWHLTATGERLELFDWRDRRVAVFLAIPGRSADPEQR
jgi:heat shock protein HslJ